MVKKKSSPKNTAQSKSKNVKTKQPKWFNRVLKTPHLLFKVILILAISIFVGRIGYMAIQDRFSVKLLDQAEEKMRQLDFPGGKKGVIERYCSERSVKFGSPGKPTCGVSLKLIYEETNTISNKNTTAFIHNLSDAGAKYSIDDEEDDRLYYKVQDFEQGLDCYMGDVKLTNNISSQPEQHIALYCQKQFQSKLYPVRD